MPKNYLMLSLKILLALYDLVTEFYLLSINVFDLGSEVDWRWLLLLLLLLSSSTVVRPNVLLLWLEILILLKLLRHSYNFTLLTLRKRKNVLTILPDKFLLSSITLN